MEEKNKGPSMSFHVLMKLQSHNQAITLKSSNCCFVSKGNFPMLDGRTCFLLENDFTQSFYQLYS